MIKRRLIRSTALVSLLCWSLSASAYDASLNALLLESSDLLQSGKIEEALVLLQKNEDKYNENREFMNNLAVAYLGNSQPDIALSIFRQLVDVDPMYSIITHNLLEMELQISGVGAEKVSPVLFVQTVESYFDDQLNRRDSNLQLANERPSATTNGTRNPQQSDISTPLPDSVTGPVSVTSSLISLPNDNDPATGTEATETATEPTQEPTSANANSVEQVIEKLVRDWANSWSNKDFDAYIGYYSNQFSNSRGDDIRSWTNKRRRPLNKPGAIQVSISNLDLSVRATDQIRVTFVQDYQSQNYQDSVLKEFILGKEPDGWKIHQENTISVYQ